MSADPWASEKSVQGPITFKLASCREVRVRSFRYSGTYDGLLEGVPTRLTNEQLIERYLQSERRFPNDPAPYLLTPLTREGRFGGVWLPPVCCRARLESLKLIDQEMHLSTLGVIWFSMPFFETPLSQVIPAALGDLDWEKHALDVDRG